MGLMTTSGLQYADNDDEIKTQKKTVYIVCFFISQFLSLGVFITNLNGTKQ